MATNKFKQVVITSEFITLGQFLKFEGIIDQGNLAKDFIMSHECKVNDEITYQRGKKLHNGDKVIIDSTSFYEITK